MYRSRAVILNSRSMLSNIPMASLVLVTPWWFQFRLTLRMQPFSFGTNIMDSQVTFEVEVGAFMRPQLRNFLNEIKLVYKRNISWIEGEGFLSRSFWITTDDFTAEVIKLEFNRIMRERLEREQAEEAERQARPWWKFW